MIWLASGIALLIHISIGAVVYIFDHFMNWLELYIDEGSTYPLSVNTHLLFFYCLGGVFTPFYIIYTLHKAAIKSFNNLPYE